MERGSQSGSARHDEFLKLAETATARAEAATDDELRDAWLQVAAQWRALAEQLERMAKF